MPGESGHYNGRSARRKRRIDSWCREDERPVKSSLLRFWDRITPGRLRALYEEWVHSFGAELYRMAYRLCGEADTAEDLVQETFYHAWKGKSQLRDRHLARAWLFQILRYRYAHLVRDRSRRIRASVSTGDLAEQIADPRASPAIRLADRDALQVALNKLDENLRTPLLMVLLQGLTCRETAKALNIPLGTVLSRMHRARQKLRSVFDSENRSEPGAVGREGSGNQPRRLRLEGGA